MAVTGMFHIFYLVVLSLKVISFVNSNDCGNFIVVQFDLQAIVVTFMAVYCNIIRI